MTYSEDEQVRAQIERIDREAAAEAAWWGEPTGTDEIDVPVGVSGPEDELVDLGAVWDEIEATGWDGEMPTVGVVPGYPHLLFYPGLNSVAGASSSAKTLFSQLIVAQVLQGGGVVVVLDVETGRRPKGYVHRLRMFGVSRAAMADRLVYVNWRTGLVPVDWLLRALRGRPATFVALDSVPEAMSAAGLNENVADDVIRWHSDLSDALLLTTGPDTAVLLIDGLPKGYAPGQDARGGVGSARKLYKVETQWRLYARSPKGSKTVDGFSILICTKDRYGTHQEGSTIAEVFYGPSGFGLRQHIPKPTVDHEEARVTVLAFIEASGPPSIDNPTGDEIAEACGPGSKEALDALLADGAVVSHRPPGRRGAPAYRYYSAKYEAG